jgi:tRNA modification GTPase
MTTIFAVSSGAPPAAIAILRLSGPRAFDAVRALAGTLPEPRVAALRALRDPAKGELIDRALVLLFPGPASATGEDLAELHVHGGRATVRAAETALERLDGLRRAEPGEFTRRALMNGRIDLSEAEGLGDLLAAETEAQRRAALTSTEGAVRRQVEDWTARTLKLAAGVELLLDHADEEDATDDVAALAQTRAQAALLAAEIDAVLAQPPVERLRDGLRVVLAGPANSGKSTLFNALAGRDAAIVSPIAGTTRDRIEAPVVRDGVAWLLIDTAGLNQNSVDPIEVMGIARSHAAIAEADLLLWLGDRPPPKLPMPVIAVHARGDAAGREATPAGRVRVAAARGDTGLLWTALHDVAGRMLPPTDAVAMNRRQRALTADASEHLRRVSREPDPLLVAEALRQARGALHAITGRAGVEAMLDALFGGFCVGK